MLFKNNLSYISVGMEMQDGVPDYVLSLNDVLMATYFGDRIMWSGRGLTITFIGIKFLQGVHNRLLS